MTSSGSGLGLWIADAVIRAQGGRIGVTPTDDAGVTTVYLRLPTESAETDGNRGR